MRLIDLIQELENLYYSYDDEYKATMGEPEIMIDSFELVRDVLGDSTHRFVYTGFQKEIHIDKSADGVYDIIRSFNTKEN